MRRTPYVVLVLLFLAMGATPSHAQGDALAKLTGLYECARVNADGSSSRGLVLIAQQKDTLVVMWRLPEEEDVSLPDGPTAVGVGIVRGNILAVSFFGPQGAGVAIYSIEEDTGLLVGQWTIIGEGGTLQDEVLTKRPGEGPAEGAAMPPGKNAPPVGRPKRL